jgi:hypothetical protein
MASSAKARAALRRKTWKGGKVKLAESEAQDEQFWASMSPFDRFVATWSLSFEGYGSSDASAARLRGSASGIRRR